MIDSDSDYPEEEELNDDRKSSSSSSISDQSYRNKRISFPSGVYDYNSNININ